METVETSTMAFVSTGSAASMFEHVVFWLSFGTLAECLAGLRDDIARWGLNPARVDRWGENSKGEASFQQTVSMGVGRSGLVVEVEGYVNGGKPLLKYNILLEPRYYTTEVQDFIRATGGSH